MHYSVVCKDWAEDYSKYNEVRFQPRKRMRAVDGVRQEVESIINNTETACQECFSENNHKNSEQMWSFIEQVGYDTIGEIQIDELRCCVAFSGYLLPCMGVQPSRCFWASQCFFPPLGASFLQQLYAQQHLVPTIVQRREGAKTTAILRGQRRALNLSWSINERSTKDAWGDHGGPHLRRKQQSGN